MVHWLSLPHETLRRFIWLCLHIQPYTDNTLLVLALALQTC